MDWVKIVATLGALALIIVVGYYNGIQQYFYPSYAQLKNVLSQKFEIEKLTFNSSGIFLEVHNGLNGDVIIYNITGEYIWLPHPVVIPSNSTVTFRINYSNLTGLENNIEKGKEVVAIIIGLGRLNVTEVTSI